MLARIRSVTEAAFQNGALAPLETQPTLLPATSSVGGDIIVPPFQIRLLRKDKKPRQKNKFYEKAPPKKNPFLPFDPALYVEHIPPSHVLLLNKFPVVQNHALIVTSAFEPQSSLLTHADHTAMWRVIMEYPSLAFYNAGPIAGASQPHKHLQVVNVDFEHDEVPFHNMINSHVRNNHRKTGHTNHTTTEMIQGLPFLHDVSGVDDMVQAASNGNFELAGELSMQTYMQMMTNLEQKVVYKDTDNENEDNVHVRPFSYNFLCTKYWMLLIPRRQECFQGISVNALGFAGFLLVRDEDRLAQLMQSGAMQTLREVTMSR